MAQNYHNPATDKTESLATAKTSQPIELAVSNVLGQVVYRDANRSGAHAHSFSIDVAGPDPGLYLYTISIGSQHITKKMLIE